MDRSLWCWGDNFGGQLGLGDYTERVVPTRVGTDVDWARLTTGTAAYTCAVRTDRSLWCWGVNGYGQLGLGDAAWRMIPTRVGSDTNWVRISAGHGHTCGVRMGHSLWCWGWNEDGQLGLGDRAERRVPTRV
jgi:alpha-tubulin suppressor-like RCC1 family protein